MKTISTFLLAFILFVGGTHAAHAFMLDDFNQASSFVLKASDGVDQSRTDSGLSGVLGGSRQLDVHFGSTTTELLTLDTAAGNLELNSSFAAFNRYSIFYNGSGGLNANLTNAGALQVFFSSDHLGLGKDTVLSLTLKDGANTVTRSKIWSPPTIFPSAPIEQDFLLTDFAGLNFASIRSILLSYEGDFANDSSLHSIQFSGDVTLNSPPTNSQAIPEPASLLLLLGGGLMAAGSKFRRRKA